MTLQVREYLDLTQTFPFLWGPSFCKFPELSFPSALFINLLLGFYYGNHYIYIVFLPVKLNFLRLIIFMHSFIKYLGAH